jgi:hypothetical protein
MRKHMLVLATIIAASSGFVLDAASNKATLDAKVLTSSSWFMSLGPGDRDQLRFFTLDGAASSALYLRRFMTPSYYLDALAGTQLKVLLWPEPKLRTLAFSPDGNSIIRETSPASLEYRRAAASRGSSAGSAAAKNVSPYEGDWEIGIGENAMTVSIRACEKKEWDMVMYFPGDPDSAIPMGYYPLFSLGDGTWRSSSAFADSLIELEYDQDSDSLVIRPMYKERPLAADLYDPVHAWRDK